MYDEPVEPSNVLHLGRFCNNEFNHVDCNYTRFK